MNDRYSLTTVFLRGPGFKEHIKWQAELLVGVGRPEARRVHTRNVRTTDGIRIQLVSEADGIIHNHIDVQEAAKTLA